MKKIPFLIGASVLLCATVPALAQTIEMLHSTPTAPARDNYTGGVGCQFRVGPNNVIVSHLGVFDINDDGLAISHNAGLFNSNGSTMLGTAVVPDGSGAFLTNGFRWVPLDPPILLSSNTTYIVAGSVVQDSGDVWRDSFVPTWNPFFVGTNATTTRHSMYGPGGNTSWPPPSFGQTGNNTTYGNVSLAYMEIDKARPGVQVTNLSFSAGQTLEVIGFASGESPIAYQWFKAPGTLLPGQTSPTLSIPNATTGDSGEYFLTATNALGGQQSASVTVSVTSFPVGISQQPTNLTVFENYPVAFSMTATGSPPIFLQWSRNGDDIADATNSAYSISAASLANNGDVYSCLASNNTDSIGHSETTSNATLTVIPNVALPQQFLHGARANTATNSFTGLVGGRFLTGNSPALVTHLGYYATQFTDDAKTNATLTLDHHVGIFSANGSVLYASAIVTAGAHDVINGYVWAPLDPPIVLSTNTTYLLVAEVFNGSDPWGETYVVPDWNPYFTGVNNSTAGNATYWGAAWPNAGAAGGFPGQMYSAPNLAILALPTPSAFVQPMNTTQYVGFNVTLTALGSGQAPLTLQWYKQPNTPLAGETNLSLNLGNVSLADDGSYYVVVSNSVTSASSQSADAVVTVLPDVGPSVDQDIQSQDAFVHQTVRFAASVSGTPPLKYQWTFNGSPIDGATNNALTLVDVSAASVGNYQLNITNDFGTGQSFEAALTVTTPAWGSYPSAVMGADLLAYYRFSDVNSGTGIATNLGSLGLDYNATYENAAGTDGPASMSNFEVGNQAVSLDGLFADVRIPPLGARVTSATIAAWVYKSAQEVPNAAIYYHRGANVFGLTVNPDATSGADSLRYTWNGTYFAFDSGLILPTNQWALVAVSITPTNAALYLQDGTGLRSTNNVASHPAQTFSATNYVGWDTAGGDIGRRWAGAIDEVMIFNRSLSADEINALYLGVPGSATLTIAPSGDNLVLTWPGGKLLEADDVTGPWTTNTTATSPFTILQPAAKKFYRVQLQP